VQIHVDPRISAIAFIPEGAVATSKARKLLPENIPHADAAANTTRGELLIYALTSRPDLLLIATEDFLHQKYRQEAMPKSFALLNKLRAAGVAAFISGAGPTVLALHTGDANEITELQRAAGSAFEVKALSICTTGAGIVAQFRICRSWRLGATLMASDQPALVNRCKIFQINKLLAPFGQSLRPLLK